MRRALSFIAVFVLFMMCPCAIAGTDNGILSEFRGELTEFTDSLPEELRKKASNYLESENALGGLPEMASASSLLRKIWDQVISVWPSTVGLFFSLFGVLILSAVLRRLQSSFSREGMGIPGELCSSLCIVVCITPWLENMVASGEAYLRSLAAMCDGVTPIACALFVASGNLTAAATVNASLMLVYTLIQNIIEVFYIPIIHFLFALSVVSYVGGVIRLDSIGRFVRQLFTWLLSLLTLVLSLVMGIQHSLALNVDTFSIRTVKFALSNVIPLVGGAISDAIGTVAGSLNIIKGACGTLGIVGVIVLLTPPLIHMLLLRLAIGGAEGAAEIMGCEKEGMLLGEIHSVFGYLLAVMALASVLFVFILALMISVRF